MMVRAGKEGFAASRVLSGGSDTCAKVGACVESDAMMSISVDAFCECAVQLATTHAVSLLKPVPTVDNGFQLQHHQQRIQLCLFVMLGIRCTPLFWGLWLYLASIGLQFPCQPAHLQVVAWPSAAHQHQNHRTWPSCRPQ